jgi:hypothetical protein
METKSRYEVMSNLEERKRMLISEKNGIAEERKRKLDRIKAIERQKTDTIVVLDRQIEDAKDELKLFDDTVEGRKSGVDELIKSVDDSLARLSDMNK